MRRPGWIIVALLAASTCRLAAAGEEPPPQLPVGSSLGEGMGQTAAPDPSALVPQIGIRGKPVLGNPLAPVTIVEFIDYQCPYCQGYAKNTFPRLKTNYIDTGKVRYVARDFPLAKHERARPAAIAAACAGEQGWFWEMHDALLTAGETPTEDLISREAETLALDAGRFAACRAEPRHAVQLDADIAAAGRLGVSGTPTFLVGASAGDQAQGRLLQGDEVYAAFEKILAGYLKPKED